MQSDSIGNQTVRTCSNDQLKSRFWCHFCFNGGFQSWALTAGVTSLVPGVKNSRLRNGLGHNTCTSAGHVWTDSGWSWTFGIACVTLHEGEVAPPTSQTLRRAIFFAVCLTAFPFEFRPRAFTIEFYRKKSIRSELMILECCFPLTLWCSTEVQ